MPELARPRLPALPWLVAALTPLAFAFTAAVASAQSDPPPPVDELVGLRLELQTQLARRDVAALEADVIAMPRAGISVGNFQDPSTILTALNGALDTNYKAVGDNLRGLAEKAKARRDEAQKDWAEVTRHRAEFLNYAEKQQALYGFNYETGSHAGFKPNVIDAALVAWALFVGGVALGLRRKEQRVDIRKAQRAAAAALVLGLLTLPGCGPAGGSEARALAAREKAELVAATAEATAKADAAAADADKKWRAAVDAWVAVVSAEKVPEKTDVGKVVRDGEEKLRQRLQGITTDAMTASQLAKDADEQRAKLADEKAKLDGLVSGSTWRGFAAMGLRVGAAVVLFGLGVAPFWSARRARTRRIRLASRTCPRCFRMDTLKLETAGGGGGSGAGGYKAGGKKKKKKAAEEDEEAEAATDDDDGEVRCGKCGLRIRRSYLTVPRLCFPTVGVRASGKTHMLVTAYDRMRKRTAPTVATVQPAPSGSDVDRRFDQLVDEIMHRRGVAGATDLVLPDPILVHVKDNDANGGTSALVNLFDYSGELINPDVDVNMLKSTAVRMDGFMLFLDPTQLYGEGADVTLDQQLAMLDEFLAHMRKERKIPVGEVIPVPVAVCLPKFDLLLSDNPIGGQSVQYIRELMDNLSPSPRQMTIDVIRERSDLVEQMLPLMFPGADIREVIEGYFGKQLLFFPMSSVSLFEHELGIKDLDRRTMAPFGVAEPMMWLLHMHGYEVFA